jgi:hypothetical protein
MGLLLELFRQNFYRIDYLIGVACPLTAFVLYKTGRMGRFPWLLFWLGCAIGLTWEAPMQILNELFPAHAVHAYTRRPPLVFPTVMILHSFWDGGLFLAGVGLVYWSSRASYFEKFKARELLILLGWGQASELWVELTATFGEAWTYIPRPWNPVLFHFNFQPITLMPQLIWLAAPVVFYFIALKLKTALGPGPQE